MLFFVLEILKSRDSVYGFTKGLYKVQSYIYMLFMLKFNARECMSY